MRHRFRPARTAAVLALAALAAGACEQPSLQRQPPHLDGVGVEHNRTLTVLQLDAALVQVRFDPQGFGRILEAAQSYYVRDRGFDRQQVEAVTAEILRVLAAAGLVAEQGGRRYVDLGDSPASLLRAVDVLAREGRISPQLRDALYRVWSAGEKLQDVDALLAFIDREFAGQKWSEKDQLVVDAFVQTARYSAVYWDRGDGAPGMRKPWVTILADALGGAVGGAAGALAGGPIGAGIGAGLFGAAVSSVFSRAAVGPGEGGTGPRR